MSDRVQKQTARGSRLISARRRGAAFASSEPRHGLPISGAIAEQIRTTIASMTIICPMCGEFDVASSVMATGQLQKLEPDQRGDVLDKARRSAQPGARPVITPYLLA
jgi:hypothetical protein